jgi:hypothetical protein
LERRETPKYLRHLQIDGSPIKLVVEKAKKEEALKTQFSASRDTVRKARNSVLAELKPVEK